ncbi:hypothetical protein I350_02989 [Cryptococcus amylolentus CBS 6273]|uniref:PIN domain-containing protein n=1 Tax=Cryptococcus amylolentus CBS 6273 TaxID=1296118 RepID=A0A1E3K8G1_9TREE|nr:hypothetical protein I350_02989 [Cryptococcus amylolentus CBS 6273]
MPEQNAARGDLATRQAALQKSLSAAYLNHQISELESKVRTANIASPAPQDYSVDASALLNTRRDPNDDLGRPDDVELDEDMRGEEQWRVMVVDISALMWAKNAVKRLVAKGWEIVIPQEALSTLDLLKKGSTPSAVAARHAARYIEHALRFHTVLSSDPSLAIQSTTSYKRGRGVRLQRPTETLPVDSMLDELAIPPMDGEENLPMWLDRVFRCVAYFKMVMDVEEKEWGTMEEGSGFDRETPPILYVGNAPVFVEVEQGRAEPTPSARDGDKNVDYTARAEGHVILQEAARFDLSLQVLRDDDVEVEAAGLGGRRPNHRGSNDRLGGGGGGGRRTGGGNDRRGGRGANAGNNGNRRKEPKKELEPPKEVKILRRQPSPADPTAARDASPDSHPSPLASPNVPDPAFPGPEIKPRDNSRSPALLARPPAASPRPALPSVNPPTQNMRQTQNRPFPARSSMGLPPRPPMGGFRPPAGTMNMARNMNPHNPGQLPHRPPLNIDSNQNNSRAGDRRGRHGGGGGSGGGGRGRGGSNTNEFVLLQRPHSFVRPIPGASTPPTTAPTPAPAAAAVPEPVQTNSNHATNQALGSGGIRGGRGQKAPPRIDDDLPPRDQAEKKPGILLLQRPR